MPFTVEGFDRWYFKKHFHKLTPEEKREALQDLPMKDRLAGLSPEQIQEYLNQLTADRAAQPRKRPRKK